jgi:hypothetical protein
MVRNVLLGTFLSRLRQLRRLANWVYPRGHGPVWRLWQLRQAGSDEAERQRVRARPIRPNVEDGTVLTRRRPLVREKAPAADRG